MSIKFAPSSDAENKKNDIAKNQLDTWENKEKIKSHSEQVLSSLPEDGSLIQMKDLYPKYCDKVENPLHRITVARVLNDFSNIGEVEKQGNYRRVKYRKADRPVEAVRKGFNSQSVDLPPWISERIQKVVEKKVEAKLDQAIDRHLQANAEKFREMVLAQDQKLKKEILEDSKNDRQELLIKIIEEHDSIKPTELYQEFHQRHELDRDLCQRTLRNYLKDLSDKGLIKSEGKGRWRTYKSVNS